MQSETPRKLSQVLQDEIDALHQDGLTIGDAYERLGTRALGVFIAFISLPALIPGISFFSGALLLILSLQMCLGIKKTWMPKFIRRYELKKATLQLALNKMLPNLRRLEKLIKPRFLFMVSSAGIRFTGIIIALFSLIILFPLPFSNLIPSLSLLCISFGLMQKDGLAMLTGTLVGILYSVAFLWIVLSVFIHFAEMI
ncbi:MAG: exopolysaccharide biosynthesis protein [Alphaproteobacteria bacterium]|nr:exopolysaccharide biosynthesis protein [Alphaproteobacteria bacterium]